MKKIFYIFCFTLTLTACSYFQQHHYCSFEQFARCEEIKRQIVYFNNTKFDLHGASSTQMTGAKHSVELESLERSYRENGCV